MLKVGDRVNHIRHGDCKDSVGTVVGFEPSGRAKIVWDKDSKLRKKIGYFAHSMYGYNTHEIKYLKKAEEFMPYDPSQQGETDDDI